MENCPEERFIQSYHSNISGKQILEYSRKKVMQAALAPCSWPYEKVT